MGHTQVGIPHNHRQRLVSQVVGNLQQGGTIHGKQGGAGMAQIVESEVGDCGLDKACFPVMIEMLKRTMQL